jgi:hypothetical protein
MANEYDIGDLIRIQGTFTDANNDAVDPDVVTVKYKDPSGTITTDTSPTNSAVGVYHVDVSVDESGTWHYRFAGTTSGGGLQGAEDSLFLVALSEF